MTEQDHLKRVLDEIRSKERAARAEAYKQTIKADALLDAADVVEVELTRFPKASTTNESIQN